MHDRGVKSTFVWCLGAGATAYGPALSWHTLPFWVKMIRTFLMLSLSICRVAKIGGDIEEVLDMQCWDVVASESMGVLGACKRSDVQRIHLPLYKVLGLGHPLILCRI